LFLLFLFVFFFTDSASLYFSLLSLLLPFLLFSSSLHALLLFSSLLTLPISSQGEASGNLYIDDGRSFAYLKSGQHLDVIFRFENSALRTTPSGSYQTSEEVERVIITGLAKKPTRASLRHHSSSSLVVPLEISSYGKTAVMIRKPNAPITSAWEIQLHYD
jgi:mannosyl-oligosaccharide alpha-1,3-glucosidase